MTERAPRELSAHEVVSAAVVLLDEHGVDGFSMRLLARHLGRSGMAAYRHVENRQALIDQAAAAVLHELDVDALAVLPWPERLAAIVRHDWRTTWSEHPWAVEVIQRGHITRRGSRHLDLVAEAYRDAGFSTEEIDLALFTQWAFVIGTLHVIVAIRALTGERDAQREDAIFEHGLANWLRGLVHART